LVKLSSGELLPRKLEEYLEVPAPRTVQQEVLKRKIHEQHQDIAFENILSVVFPQRGWLENTSDGSKI